MSCAMVYWGKIYRKFEDEFLQYGAVVDLRRIRGKQIGYCESNAIPMLLEEY